MITVTPAFLENLSAMVGAKIEARPTPPSERQAVMFYAPAKDLRVTIFMHENEDEVFGPVVEDKLEGGVRTTIRRGGTIFDVLVQRFGAVPREIDKPVEQVTPEACPPTPPPST